jgi:hypothetical protein
MEGMNDRTERNALREIVFKAEQSKVVTKSEAGFVLTLVDRFRGDIERKQRQVMVLQGELAQLRANEKIICDVIDNIIRAAERDEERRRTADRLRNKKLGIEEKTEETGLDNIVEEMEEDRFEKEIMN